MSPTSARIENWAAAHSVPALHALELFLERLALMLESGSLSEQAAESAAMADMETNPDCYRPSQHGIAGQIAPRSIDAND